VVQHAYRRVRRARERVGGVAIERVWLYATPHKTPVTRLWNHLSFASSAFGPAFAGPRPDVVLASMPPLFLGVTALLAAWWHRAPFVLDCRDDWPWTAVSLGELREGLSTRLLGGLTLFLQRRAARVVAANPAMQRAFQSHGVDAGRLVLCTNGADTDLFRPAPPDGRCAEGGVAGRPLTVLYAGTHGLIHGMEALLDAAERLRERRDLRFVLVGDGVAKVALQRRARETGLTQVEFRPSVAPERLVEEIQAAGICVATMRDHPQCAEAVPVKLYDYLACGRPVVAAVAGDAARLVEESGGGIVVRPEDGAALAAALASLSSDPALRATLAAHGPPYIEANYSRRASGARLAAVLDEVRRLARGRKVVPRPSGVAGAAKRLTDALVAGALLVALTPLLALIALVVRLDSPGPAFFRQRRAGRGGREFSILKFRTMEVGTPDLASHLMGPGAAEVTRVGRVLRRTSLDELPQLLNVLLGDMSLVGPRPALHNQHDLVALRRQAGVDALRPGVTGWAQIHGRDDIPLAIKVEYDRWYMDHASFPLDLWIVLRTPGALLSSRGVF
jgi:O-antigen biosynthesis protein WbqP